MILVRSNLFPFRVFFLLFRLTFRVDLSNFGRYAANEPYRLPCKEQRYWKKNTQKARYLAKFIIEITLLK